MSTASSPILHTASHAALHGTGPHATGPHCPGAHGTLSMAPQIPPAPGARGRGKSRLPQPEQQIPVPMAPTAERHQHSPIALMEEADPAGVTVLHARALDTLSRMVRNGLIEADWARAGDRFRRDFHAAHFDPLSALDLRRARGAGGREAIIDRVEDARERVWEAMNILGGMACPSGSVVWHVVGRESSLRDWCLRQVWGGGRSLRHEVATGILVGALGALAGYYNRPRAGRPHGA